MNIWGKAFNGRERQLALSSLSLKCFSLWRIKMLINNRYDFVVIKAPSVTILRPITPKGLEFVLSSLWDDKPKALGNSLSFKHEVDYSYALDVVLAHGLTVEVL
jgi:hypothetical protein